MAAGSVRTVTAAVLSGIHPRPPYADSRPTRLERLRLADPDPTEVVVRIGAAGLCHSDLSVITGALRRPLPTVLGHEAAGTVEETGSAVTDVAVGDTVVFSFVPGCGRCRYCQVGRSSLCEPGARANAEGRLVSGTRPFCREDGEPVHHHMGVSGFAEATVASQQSLVKVPDDVALTDAALFGCTVLTGLGAVINTAQARAGDAVAVFGLGGVGLSAVMGARLAGCHPIIAVDPVPAKRDLALRLGATSTYSAFPGIADRIRADTDGGVDFAFDTAGSAEVLATAYAANRRGGTTVAVGLPHPSQQLTVPAAALAVEERRIIGSYMGSSVPRRDIPRYLSLFRAGRLPVDLLRSHLLRLDDINAGFDALAQGRAVRQVITFD